MEINITFLAILFGTMIIHTASSLPTLLPETTSTIYASSNRNQDITVTDASTTSSATSAETDLPSRNNSSLMNSTSNYTIDSTNAESSVTIEPTMSVDTEEPNDTTTSPLSGDCDGNHTAANEQLISDIKRSILQRLGMKKIPDISNLNTTVQQRRDILRLYRKSLDVVNAKQRQNDDDDDDDAYLASEEFRSFTDTGDWPEKLIPPRKITIAKYSPKKIYFNVDIHEPDDPHLETVITSATLNIYKLRMRPQNLIQTDIIDRSVRIDIYQIVQSLPSAQNQNGRWLKKLVDSKLVSVSSGNGWEQFSISTAVQDWIRDPLTNLGLEIVADTRYSTDEVIDWVTWNTDDVSSNGKPVTKMPTVDVLSKHKAILGKRRMERSVQEDPRPGDCEPGLGDGLCCRDKLEISFSSLGWNTWIFEPPSYMSYYCRGWCPSGYRVFNRFSQIKSMIRDANPASSVSVQCTATRFNSLSIVHYNEHGELTVTIMEDMLAGHCMCA